MVSPSDEVRNGDHCEVIAGTHKGRRGTVEDWNLSKTGHATITVREPDGARFKTLARNTRRSA
ncbi:KOW motif-containing protein [Novosphingobium sp. B 225]|uniref:KOW motif-containing protein n=1 Tax=Novosphingobium sp. B 225 TaxID=1961849 RepID=UPI000B4BF490|nr:KOW motif-containing protein [Novosphingobium sp. B 225]